MRLAAAAPGHVVRNSANGRFYLFEHMERGRARIYPLELFPNGLLIPKPAPTLVEADMQVVQVGPWEDGLVVEGKPSNDRAAYEQELLRVELELQSLLEAYDELPRDGKGKLSRGSHANKIRAKKIRIDALRRGLGLAGRAPAPSKAEPELEWPRERDGVQLPSGLPAIVLALRPVGDAIYARCRTSLRGIAMEVDAPSDVLRPLASASICDW